MTLKAYSLVTLASSGPNTLEQQTGESYDFLDDTFLDPSTVQQDGIVMDPSAFPNAEVIENMIYEPANIDWVCSSKFEPLEYSTSWLTFVA